MPLRRNRSLGYVNKVKFVRKHTLISFKKIYWDWLRCCLMLKIFSMSIRYNDLTLHES